MEKYRDSEENQIMEMRNEEKRKFSIKSLLIPIIFTIGMSFVFSFCMLNTTMKDLEGVWVRQPDDNLEANGMIIEIKKNGGLYVGEVIDIDDDSTMPIGTFKWSGFQKDALNVFVQYDMSMSEIPTERTYSTSYVTVSRDKRQLNLYCPTVSRGSHQIWIKE